MSCQARKKKKDPFPLVPRGCRVSIRGSSPRAPGAHYREARGSGSRGIGGPRLFPRGARPPLSSLPAPRRPGPAAPPHRSPPGAHCRGAARPAFQLETPGSLAFPPTPPPLPRPARSLEVAGGNELGTEEGEKPGARAPLSPCCVTLESFLPSLGRDVVNGNVKLIKPDVITSELPRSLRP